MTRDAPLVDNVVTSACTLSPSSGTRGKSPGSSSSNEAPTRTGASQNRNKPCSDISPSSYRGAYGLGNSSAVCHRLSWIWGDSPRGNMAIGVCDQRDTCNRRCVRRSSRPVLSGACDTWHTRSPRRRPRHSRRRGSWWIGGTGRKRRKLEVDSILLRGSKMSGCAVSLLSILPVCWLFSLFPLLLFHSRLSCWKCSPQSRDCRTRSERACVQPSLLLQLRLEWFQGRETSVLSVSTKKGTKW